MNRITACFFALSASLAVAAAASAASAPAKQLTLESFEHSKETAVATLRQQPDGSVHVSVVTHGGGSDPQPLHIHNGNCENQPSVKYPLTTIINGRSETTLKGVTLEELTSGEYAMNIHKSTKEIGTYMACGNLKDARSI